MKRLISLFVVLTMVLALSISPAVYGHNGTDELYDFNNYVGDDSTLRKDPPAGTDGYWGYYIPNPVQGGGGTSVKDGNNTYIKISQGGINYLRALDYYPNTPITSSIHFEYSTMLDSNLSTRTLQLQLYNSQTNSTSSMTNIGIFYGNEQHSTAAFDRNTSAVWSPDKWYRVSVDYNVVSGAYRYKIYDIDAKTTLADISGHKTYGSYDSVKRIRFAYSSGNAATTYYDDVYVKSTNRFYVTENYDFEDFSVVGTTLLTQNTSAADANGSFASVEPVKTEKGQSLALRANMQKGVNFLRNGLSYTGTIGFDYSIYLHDYASMRRIQVAGTADGSSSLLYGKLIEIKNGTGKVFFCGEDTGNKLDIKKWYDIKITYNMADNCAKLDVKSGGKDIFSYITDWTDDAQWDSGISTVKAYYFDLGYTTITPGVLTETYIDDVTVGNKMPFYLPGENKAFPFAIADSYPSSADESAQPLDFFMVTYTNKLDKASVLPQNIVINGASPVKAEDITFEDDYTIKIRYQLQEGTNYHIILKNIKNTSSQSLTDFVEFKTKLAEIEFSDFSYSKAYGTETLAPGAICEGVITSSVTVWANGGKEYDLLCAMALYNNNTKQLEDIKISRISPSSSKEKYSLQLTITEEKKQNCFIKSFLWEMTDMKLKPLHTKILPPASDGPVVILKLDDVRGRNDNTSYKNFDRIYEYAAENNIPMAFGVIGNSLRTDDTDYYGTLRKWNESGLIEVWHHGYYHSYFNQSGEPWADGDGGKYGEFKLSYDKQLECFKSTYDLLKEKAGIEIKSFGAPFNATDDNTVKMLNTNYPGVKVVMTALAPSDLPKYTETPGFMHLTNRIHVETATGVFGDFDAFKKEFASKMEDDYILIQMHGGLWWEINGSRPEEQFTRFTQMVDFMKESGATFMTPYGYYLECME